MAIWGAAAPGETVRSGSRVILEALRKIKGRICAHKIH